MSASIRSNSRVFRLGRGGVFAACLMLVVCPSGCSNGKQRATQAILEVGSQPGADAATRVRPFLDHPDGEVRTVALVVLAAVAPDEAAARIDAAMADPAPGVRAAAARIAGDTRATSSAGALEALARTDPDGHVRLRATEALARIGGEAAVAALGAGLADPSVAVRTAAVRGLAKAGAPAWVGPLSNAAVEDVSWETRVEAVQALGAAAVPEAYGALDRALADPNEFVRAAAARTIKGLSAKGIERPLPSPSPEPAEKAPSP